MGKKDRQFALSLSLYKHVAWGSLVANMKLKGYDGTLAFGAGGKSMAAKLKLELIDGY